MTECPPLPKKVLTLKDMKTPRERQLRWVIEELQRMTRAARKRSGGMTMSAERTSCIFHELVDDIDKLITEVLND